jgi:peptide/nickel transport system substrate-binding protein
MRKSRNRWLFLLVLIAGLGGFTAVWYGALRDTGSGAPDYGGQYVEGMTGAPGRVNPLFAGLNAVDQSLVSLVYAGLTRLDDRGRPYPNLAETWTVSDDGLRYTFTLRDGLVWPDATPLTVDDVLFTYDLLTAASLDASPAPPDALATAKLTKVDARSFQIELTHPFAPLPAYLTTGILPQHLLKDVNAEAMANASFNQRPVGAGPYRLVELTPDHAVLEPNSVYHAGMPFIQRFELRFFRDGQALLSALQAGELDGAYFTTGISEVSQVDLEHDSGLRFQVLNTSDTTFCYLNLDDPMFGDRRVRQALLYALDRDKIAGLVYGGMAHRADSPLVSGIWSEADALSRYATDPRTAGLLLDEAGWQLNASGERERDGEKLAFELTTTPDTLDVAVANEVAAQWKQIGVNATVSVKGSTTVVRDVLGPRAFDALIFEQPAAPDPDPYAYWHSSQATASGFNLASLDDERVDQLLSDARNTPQNLKREDIYRQFQEIFAQEVPSLPLFSSTALYIQRLVKDAQPGLITQPGDRFWQVQQWHVKTK